VGRAPCVSEGKSTCPKEGLTVEMVVEEVISSFGGIPKCGHFYI